MYYEVNKIVNLDELKENEIEDSSIVSLPSFT